MAPAEPQVLKLFLFTFYLALPRHRKAAQAEYGARAASFSGISHFQIQTSTFPVLNFGLS